MKALTDFWVHGQRDAQRMWDSWQDPHRQQALIALSLLPGVTSVFEIGCGSGPNLRLIRDRFPHMQLGGSEPNRGLREFAQREFPGVMDITLPDVPLLEWDVVLSMYTLAYVEDAGRVLDALYRNRTKHLILIEPSANLHPFGSPGIYQGHAMTSYVHDYKSLGERAGWRLAWRWPMIPHHQGLNMILVMTRG